MIGRTTVVLALAGSAVAFSPMMSMDMGRRQLVQTAGAAAVAAPLLRANPAAAKAPMDAQAPKIQVFDHRGCQRGGPNKEYKGAPSGDSDDEMCVGVAMSKVSVSDVSASKFLAQVISYEKGIDGDYLGNGKGAFVLRSQ
jgi:hypothetical protein